MSTFIDKGLVLKTNDLSNYFSPEWLEKLDVLLKSDYFSAMMHYIHYQYAQNPQMILPSIPTNIFGGLKTTNPLDIKVMILGVEAELASSNNKLFGTESQILTANHIKQNKILSEMYDNHENLDTSLKHWEDEGVLMINTSLLSKVGYINSFANIFNYFIKNIVNYISILNPDLIVACPRGNCLDLVSKHVDRNNIVTLTHAFDLASGPTNKSVYAEINEQLNDRGIPTIEWLKPRNK